MCSFLDELFPSSPPHGSQGEEQRAPTVPSAAPEAHAIGGVEVSASGDSDMQDWQSIMQTESKITRTDQTASVVHGMTRGDASNLSDELDDWLRELDRSSPEKAPTREQASSSARGHGNKEPLHKDGRPRDSLRRRQQQREHEEIARQRPPSSPTIDDWSV